MTFVLTTLPPFVFLQWYRWSFTQRWNILCGRHTQGTRRNRIDECHTHTGARGVEHVLSDIQLGHGHEKGHANCQSDCIGGIERCRRQCEIGCDQWKLSLDRAGSRRRHQGGGRSICLAGLATIASLGSELQSMKQNEKCHFWAGTRTYDDAKVPSDASSLLSVPAREMIRFDTQLDKLKKVTSRYDY